MSITAPAADRETLADPATLGVRDLLTQHAEYLRRDLYDKVWQQDSFTEAERAHQLAVEREYRAWEAARLWLISRRYHASLPPEPAPVALDAASIDAWLAS